MIDRRDDTVVHDADGERVASLGNQIDRPHPDGRHDLEAPVEFSDFDRLSALLVGAHVSSPLGGRKLDQRPFIGVHGDRSEARLVPV
jgi:hypothetical protein